jgi:predicted nucleic acid-binding protein
VLSIDESAVVRAAGIVKAYSRISAREALHTAVMERNGISPILSFDSNFDQWSGLPRIHQI